MRCDCSVHLPLSIVRHYLLFTDCPGQLVANNRMLSNIPQWYSDGVVGKGQIDVNDSMEGHSGHCCRHCLQISPIMMISVSYDTAYQAA